VTLQGDARRRFAARHAVECWLWEVGRSAHAPGKFVPVPAIRRPELLAFPPRHTPERAGYDE
jgi:hypothetical protein